MEQPASRRSCENVWRMYTSENSDPVGAEDARYVTNTTHPEKEPADSGRTGNLVKPQSKEFSAWLETPATCHWTQLDEKETLESINREWNYRKEGRKATEGGEERSRTQEKLTKGQEEGKKKHHHGISAVWGEGARLRVPEVPLYTSRRAHAHYSAVPWWKGMTEPTVHSAYNHVMRQSVAHLTWAGVHNKFCIILNVLRRDSHMCWQWMWAVGRGRIPECLQPTSKRWWVLTLASVSWRRPGPCQGTPTSHTGGTEWK